MITSLYLHNCLTTHSNAGVPRLDDGLHGDGQADLCVDSRALPHTKRVYMISVYVRMTSLWYFAGV